MSIVIKSTELSYKDPDTGEYTGINVVAEKKASELLGAIESEGATQLSAIESEGTSQVSAVEAKGIETLDSIPDDYTDLGQSLNQILEYKTISSNSKIFALDGTNNVISKWGNGNSGGLWFACEPDTLYVLTETVGNQIKIAWTENIPAVNEPLFDYYEMDFAPQIQYVTGSTAKYIVVQYTDNISSYPIATILEHSAIKKVLGAKCAFPERYTILRDTIDEILETQTISSNSKIFALDGTNNVISKWGNGNSGGLWFACEPDTLYVLTETVGNQIKIAWTENIPAVNEPLFDYYESLTFENVSYKTGSTAKYIVVQYTDNISSYPIATILANSIIKKILGAKDYIGDLNEYFKKNVFNWTYGSLDSSGVDSVPPVPGYITDFISLNDNLEIVKNVFCDSDYHFIVFLYSSKNITSFIGRYNGTAFGSSYAWVTEFDFEKFSALYPGYYFRFLLRKNDESSFSFEDLNNIFKATTQNILELNKELITATEKLNNYNLPSYWVEYLNNKKQTLNLLDMELGYSGVSFIFVTDIHWNINYHLSPNIIRWLTQNTNLKQVVQGGDLMRGNSSIKENAIREMLEWRDSLQGIDCINIVGNHDYNANNQEDPDQKLTNEEFYALFLKPFENKVIFNQKTYGYRDDPAQKIRYIYLNTGSSNILYIGTEQLNWMASRLQELDSGWSALIFGHQIFTGANPSSVPAGGSLKYYYSGTLIKNKLDSIYDNLDCSLIGVISGHAHRDYHEYSLKGYPLIVTTCDACWSAASMSDPINPNRTYGTITEQAMDIFYINTSTRSIKTIRIGAGDTISDRTFTY